MPARIACFLIPRFPLAARLRGQPDLADEALVLLEGQGPAARVLSASAAAEARGVRAGHSLPQARGLWPRLLAQDRDAASEESARRDLRDIAERFSPLVEELAPGAVALDIPAGGETALAHAAVRRAKTLGLPLSVGVAGGVTAARIAAQAARESVHIVPAGRDRDFLAPLSLDHLCPAPETAGIFHRWGLRTMDDLAQIPLSKIIDRLGPEGRRLHASARGVDDRPLLPRRPPPALWEEAAWEWPVMTLEPFLHGAFLLLERLSGRLAAAGFSARRWDMSLSLDPEGKDERALDLGAPTREAAPVLALARRQMEAFPPAAPVVGLRFSAQPEGTRHAQGDLFAPPALPPDQLGPALARLEALLGPDRVGAPRAVDGHRPERHQLAPFAPPPFRPLENNPPGVKAVRALRPAAPAAVSLRAGRPSFLRGPLSGPVRRASGPWKMEEGWWTHAPARRDYWDLELAEGALCRVYHDALKKSWFVDGIYD